MYKNLRRYRKEVRKAGLDDSVLNFTPLTFILPQDWALFVEEVRRRGDQSKWIFKPQGRSQGRGIFIVQGYNNVKRFEPRGSGASSGQQSSSSRDQYVISEYVDRPLLIGGKKFDLRIYVLVHSYRPLVAYISRQGFARFCNVKYDNDAIENSEMHLTNTSLQKKSTKYAATHGNKWPLGQMFLFLESTRGAQASARLKQSIDFTVLHSLKAVQTVMNSDQHSFELYGYDLLIDQDLKAWLIEVNASPSLSATTPDDRAMKTQVVHEALALACPEDWGDISTRFSKHLPHRLGSFDLLFDEREELRLKIEKQRETLELNRVTSRSERKLGVV